MGLAWQQAPLAHGAIGRFLTPAPLQRLEPEPGQGVVSHGIDRGLDADEPQHP
ncbi:hypothetical protein ACFVWX_03430 [Streptomyces sp. NPDC058220]|uniref:hypothetical protein n=1 Tax=unclassified Streptomyces TaxID=2593676 RepID=UPI00365871BD